MEDSLIVQFACKIPQYIEEALELWKSLAGLSELMLQVACLRMQQTSTRSHKNSPRLLSTCGHRGVDPDRVHSVLTYRYLLLRCKQSNLSSNRLCANCAVSECNA
jgi:hypothetical protein